MNAVITARYVARHYNARTRTTIPAYWTPDVDGLEGVFVWPCATEQEAVAMGEKLVAEGRAEV